MPCKYTCHTRTHTHTNVYIYIYIISWIYHFDSLCICVCASNSTIHIGEHRLQRGLCLNLSLHTMNTYEYMFKHHCMSQNPENCQESRHGSSWLLAGMKSFLSDHGLPGSALLGVLFATWSITFNHPSSPRTSGNKSRYEEWTSGLV